MNVYTLSYTILFSDDPLTDEKPAHKKYTFEFDGDILGAINEATEVIYEKYKSQSPAVLLFRSITLDNAKEVYEIIKPMMGDKDE